MTDPGTVVIGGVDYDGGLHAFAKYNRSPFRRRGWTYALQIQDAFSVVRPDGSVQTGQPGDYLLGPDPAGYYWIEDEITFDANWVPTSFEEIGSDPAEEIWDPDEEIIEP